jgi:hypothetical protein
MPTPWSHFRSPAVVSNTYLEVKVIRTCLQGSELTTCDPQIQGLGRVGAKGKGFQVLGVQNDQWAGP